MEITEAILSRRTIKDFKPDPVPDDVLDRALTAGIWAQNHRLTQPWRFIVLGPETHRALAIISGDSGKKILSKPRIVAVTYRLDGDSQQRIEDFAATCCAIQNIQLAAWSAGLGMQWSTGKLTRNPGVHALLKIDPMEEEMVGFLYFGYPAGIPHPAPRKPLRAVTRRLP